LPGVYGFWRTSRRGNSLYSYKLHECSIPTCSSGIKARCPMRAVFSAVWRAQFDAAYWYSSAVASALSWFSPR
jgi:hypothetical protein